MLRQGGWGGRAELSRRRTLSPATMRRMSLSCNEDEKDKPSAEEEDETSVKNKEEGKPCIKEDEDKPRAREEEMVKDHRQGGCG